MNQRSKLQDHDLAIPLAYGFLLTWIADQIRRPGGFTLTLVIAVLVLMIRFKKPFALPRASTLLILSFTVLHCAQVLMPRMPNHLYMWWITSVTLLLFARQSRATLRVAVQICVFFLYFWTAVHKLNEDFFSGLESCAVAVPHFGFSFPPGEWLLPWVPLIAVLIVMVEAAAAVAAIIPKTRKLVLPVVLFFHATLSFLGFADFGFIIAWTWGAVLALDESEKDSPWLRQLIKVTLITVLSYVALTLLIRYGIRDLSPYRKPLVGFTALPLFILVGWKALKAYKPAPSSLFKLPRPFSARVYAALAVLALFQLFWGAQPYLGARTIGVYAMFSNLKTEEPNPNHFFLRGLKIFKYQDERLPAEPYLAETDDCMGFVNTGMEIPAIEVARCRTPDRLNWIEKRWHIYRSIDVNRPQECVW